jgi:heme A synthase
VFEKTGSLALCVLTFALVVLGGIVHATGASLACPDWPTCHGTLFPAMIGGVLFEHSHRILAASVVALTAGLAVWADVGRANDSRRQLQLKRVTLIALGILVLQALLGGATVLFRLPPAISVAHLAVAMTFFVTSILLSWLIHTKGETTGPRVDARRRLVMVAMACVGLQILLGAWVKHTASSLSCLSLLGCDGSSGPLNARQWLHMAHRGWALVTTGVIVWTAIQSRRERIKDGRSLMWLALALIAVQIVLGLLSVLTTLAVWAVTTHLAVGALLLAVLFLEWLLSAVPSPPRISCVVRRLREDVAAPEGPAAA